MIEVTGARETGRCLWAQWVWPSGRAVIVRCRPGDDYVSVYDRCSWGWEAARTGIAGPAPSAIPGSALDLLRRHATYECGPSGIETAYELTKALWGLA